MNVVELPARSARRLAAAYYAKEGALAVCRAAQVLVRRYEEMLRTELEDREVQVPPGGTVHHAVEDGRITVTPADGKVGARKGETT